MFSYFLHTKNNDHVPQGCFAGTGCLCASEVILKDMDIIILSPTTTAVPGCIVSMPTGSRASHFCSNMVNCLQNTCSRHPQRASNLDRISMSCCHHDPLWVIWPHPTLELFLYTVKWVVNVAVLSAHRRQWCKCSSNLISMDDLVTAMYNAYL